MLNQKLVITYSNQKLRQLKTNYKLINPIDKIITLDDLIVEVFEKKNFKIIIDKFIGSSIVYKLIQENIIEYFNYLKADDDSLSTIDSFCIQDLRFIKSKKQEKILENYSTLKKLPIEEEISEPQIIIKPAFGKMGGNNK